MAVERNFCTSGWLLRESAVCVCNYLDPPLTAVLKGGRHTNGLVRGSVSVLDTVYNKDQQAKIPHIAEFEGETAPRRTV